MLRYTKFIFCPKCSSKELHEYNIKALLCKSCGYIYYHNPAAAVAAIIEIDNKIILTRRGSDPFLRYLDLPGGFVDYDESFEDAIKREIKEELNLDLHNLSYFGSSPNRYIYRDVCYFTTDIFFICPLAEIGMIEVKDDIIDYVLVEPEKINFENLAFSSCKEILYKYINL